MSTNPIDKAGRWQDDGDYIRWHWSEELDKADVQPVQILHFPAVPHHPKPPLGNPFQGRRPKLERVARVFDAMQEKACGKPLCFRPGENMIRRYLREALWKPGNVVPEFVIIALMVGCITMAVVLLAWLLTH